MRFACVLLAACAPISSQTKVVDVVSASDRVRDVAEESIVASIQPSADAFVVEARTHRTCRESVVEHVRITRYVERSAYKPAFVGELTFGILLGAVGGFLIIDHQGTEADGVFGPGVNPETGRAAGFSAAAIGGLLLIAATIDGVRARDRVEDGGTTTRKRPVSGPPISCGDEPARAVMIAGITAASEVPLGTTDAQGRLRITWDALPPGLIEGSSSRPEARLVARVGERTFSLGQVSLEAARRQIATRARSDAEAANVPERWDDLAARFPAEHGDEATRRARELRVAAVRAALEKNEIAAANVQLAALEKRYKGDADVEALATEVRTREANAAREALWKQAEDAVAVADPAAPVERFTNARDALAAAEAAGTDLRATALRTRLDAARAQRLKTALDTAKQSKDIVAARAALADAETLAPGDPALAPMKRAVDTREAASLRAQARRRVAVKAYAEAEELLARAIALRPEDKSLARERDRIAKLVAKQAALAATKTAPTNVKPAKTEPANTEPAKTEPNSDSATSTAKTATSKDTTVVATTPEPAKPDAAKSASTASVKSQPSAITLGTATKVEATTIGPRTVEVPRTAPSLPAARASARYRLRKGTPRMPVDWIHVPRDCSGRYVGPAIRIDCEVDALTLLRTDLDVSVLCSASSCTRCKELQGGLLPKAKLDASSDRCEEAAP